MKKCTRKRFNVTKSTVAIVISIVLAFANTSCTGCTGEKLSLEMAPPHPLKVADAEAKGITLYEPEDAINIEQVASIQPVDKQKATTPIGTNNVLVILVQFPNGGANYTGAPNGAMANNVAYFQGLCNAVSTYYTTVSYNQLTVNFTVDPNIYTLSNTMDFYGAPAVASTSGDAWAGNQLGGGIQNLIWEAVNAADPNNNFATYDSIMIYHAGAGEEGDVLNNSPNDIWSARWSGFIKATGDGVNITAAIIVPETETQDGNTFSSLGVTCHEYGHELGLPDLYDTKQVKTNNGIGNWGLMAGGSWNGPGQDGSSPAHPCAWSKEFLGWVTPAVLTLTQAGINIPQVETNATVFRVNISATEYFLIENKQLVNYDQFLPGCGLLIWHIDDSVRTMDYDGDGTNNWNDNDLQWVDSQKFVDLEEGDGSGHLDNMANRGDASDPYYAGNGQMSPAPDEFSPTSDGAGPGDAQGVTGPQSDDNSGTSTSMSITNISACGATMTFDFTLPAAPAVLVSSISAAPVQVSSGQQITVTMTVTNRGGNTVNNVVPSALVVNTTGTASAALLSGPIPASANIPVGNFQNYTWTYLANAGSNGGTVSFTGNASGIDAVTSNLVSSLVTTSNSVTIQVPAFINANLTANLRFVIIGQNITVYMIVSNTGQATANNVTPSPLLINTTGIAAVTYVSGPTPGSDNIPGGSSRTFTWAYTCNSGDVGDTITFSGNATGTDANTGNPVASNMDSVTITVRLPAGGVLSELPFKFNKQLRPLSDYRIKRAEKLKSDVEELIEKAKTEEKDTTECENLLNQAKEALKKAHMYFTGTNYVAANNWAIKAIELITKAKECLENL
jgi:M6 family metalloprotease-like protein